MAGCNDECHCFQEAFGGLVSDGLGTATEPYTIGPDEGRTIPEAMTTAERGALTPGDDDRGWLVMDTDTGIVYVWTGSVTGWVAVSIEAYAVASGAAISAGSDTYQTFGSLVLSSGLWSITAKGWVGTTLGAADAIDESIDDYTARLFQVGTAGELDVTSMTASLWLNGGTYGGTVRSPFALQRLARLAAADTVSLQVKRANTAMTSTVHDGKLQATRIAYSTSV